MQPHYIRLRYIVALSLIASVMFVSSQIVRRTLEINRAEATIINVSGMQRMLSQRIALLSQSLLTPDEDIETLRSEFKAAVDRFEENHEMLTDQSGQSIISDHSDEILELYFSKPQNMDERVKQLISASRKLLNNEPLKSEELAVFGIRYTTGLLEGLNDVVNQFELEANGHVADITKLETFVLLFGLTVLLLEIIFIFRPMESLVHASLDKLSQQRDQSLELSKMAISAANAKDEQVSPQDKPLKRPEPQDNDENSTKSRSDNLKTQVLFALQPFATVLNGNGVKLNINIHEVTDNQWVIDHDLIKEILHNLVQNAVNFTETGSIDVEINIADGQRCLITVRDTGVGMSEDVQAQMYNTFYKYPPPFNPNYKGTGLGLSITKQIVELMEGKISCESSPGNGTSFLVSVPIEKPMT